MASVRKRLFAGPATSGTDPSEATTIYTASNTPGADTVISSIVVCNTSSSANIFTISIDTATGSGVFSGGTYIVYQASIAGNDTIALTLGLILDSTNRYLKVGASTPSVIISGYGAENTPSA